MSLPTILLIGAAVSIAATVISIFIAFNSEREARSAIFPIVREEETLRARRARIYIFGWAAVTAVFLGGWLASQRILATPADTPITQEIAAEPLEEAEVVAFSTDEIEATSAPTNTPTAPPPTPVTETQPTDTPIPPTSTPAPPDTPTPSPTETSPTQEATATETPIPPTVAPTTTPVPPTPTNEPVPTDTPVIEEATEEPTSEPESVEENIEESETTSETAQVANPAPSQAEMGPIEFASEITEDVTAVDPGDVFPSGIERLYAIFPYRGMENGLDYKLIWYRDDVELWRDEGEWEWGRQARLFSFFSAPSAGQYKLELHVNDSILATGFAEIQ